MLSYLSRANRLSRRLGAGYRRSAAVVSFNHDGIEVARVRSTRRFLPVWHIAVFVYLALVIRLVVMADIGPAGYASRLDEMREGNVIERFAAIVMQMDPISQSLASSVRTGLRNMGAI